MDDNDPNERNNDSNAYPGPDSDEYQGDYEGGPEGCACICIF
jgi:hypothetical protein